MKDKWPFFVIAGILIIFGLIFFLFGGRRLTASNYDKYLDIYMKVDLEDDSDFIDTPYKGADGGTIAYAADDTYKFYITVVGTQNDKYMYEDAEVYCIVSVEYDKINEEGMPVSHCKDVIDSRIFLDGDGDGSTTLSAKLNENYIPKANLCISDIKIEDASGWIKKR